MHRTAQRNEQLDGLRGYAALAVVYFHSILLFDFETLGRLSQFGYFDAANTSDLLSKLTLELLNGLTAVKLFFILSGAVLFESLTQDDEPAPARIAHFLIRRFFRIYPALFVCVLVCWACFSAASIPLTANDLLLNLALYDFRIVGVSWTLNVEAWGALLLVVFFLAYRALREFGLILVAILIGQVFGDWVKGHLVLFNGYVYCFTLGALISTRLGKATANAIPGASWPFLLLGTIFARHAIQDTVAALLIAMIYYRKAGALGRYLASPVSVFLGRLSYSFYLFNTLFLGILAKVAYTVPAWHSRPILFGLLWGTLIGAATIPVAWLSERFLERPFIRLGRRLTASKPREDAGLDPGELTQSS